MTVYFNHDLTSSASHPVPVTMRANANFHWSEPLGTLTIHPDGSSCEFPVDFFEPFSRTKGGRLRPNRTIPAKIRCTHTHARARNQAARLRRAEKPSTRLKKIMPDARSVEGMDEPTDGSDRASAWLRRFPSLPAFTTYVHYPPSPARRYTARYVTGLPRMLNNRAACS